MVFECRDSFVGDAQALVAPKMAPWAAAAGRHQEESASDLEGGDSGYHQEQFTQPPPPPPRKPVAAKEEKKKTAQVGAAGGRGFVVSRIELCDTLDNRCLLCLAAAWQQFVLHCVFHTGTQVFQAPSGTPPSVSCTVPSWNHDVGIIHVTPFVSISVSGCTWHTPPHTAWPPLHVDAQEAKREQMEEQRRAAAAARQEIKEDRKPKQGAAGPAPSMALRTAASLQRALSNDDDGMFWDYGPAVSQRGMAPPYCLLVT